MTKFVIALVFFGLGVLAANFLEISPPPSQAVWQLCWSSDNRHGFGCSGLYTFTEAQDRLNRFESREFSGHSWIMEVPSKPKPAKEAR